MIYEFGVLLTYLLLSILLYFSIRYFKIIKTIREYQPSRKKDSKIYEQNVSRLKLLNLSSIILLLLVLVSRITSLVFAPTEMLRINQIPNILIYYLLLSFFMLAAWTTIIFFLYLNKDIKIEERLLYLQSTMVCIIIAAVLDLIFSIPLFAYGFHKFFTVKSDILVNTLIPKIPQLLPLIVIIVILIIILALQYLMFALKRSLYFIKQYWIALFLLLVILAIYTLEKTAYQLGWYESLAHSLKFFSWHYGYAGWIIFVFFAIVLFSNTAAIIILSLKNKWRNLNGAKSIMLPLVKIGFIASIILSALVTLPELFLWYY